MCQIEKALFLWYYESIFMILNKLFSKIIQKSRLSSLRNDIGIDLGTANILVYVKGLGVVINEPSVVAVNNKTDRVVAVGMEAKNMLGRTPQHIRTVRPIVDGVISDYEITEEMLAYLIQKANGMQKKALRPRIVIGIPCEITNVETRAVYDAAIAAGASEVYIIEEPIAAAIGAGLNIHEAEGVMIVDSGGGTTDIAVLSLGGTVKSKSIKLAGDKLTSDIISFIRDEYKMSIGDKTAEKIKMTIGSAMPIGEIAEAVVKGRDLVTGLPKEILLTDNDVRGAMYQTISYIVESIREVIENTPPEILTDVMKNGIVMTGGGAMIKGLDTLIEMQLKLPVKIAEDPLGAVARGCGIILDNIEAYESLMIDVENAAILR